MEKKKKVTKNPQKVLILNTGSTLADTQKLVNSCGMGKISHPMGLRLVSRARLTGALATYKGRDLVVSSDIIVFFVVESQDE